MLLRQYIGRVLVALVIGLALFLIIGGAPGLAHWIVAVRDHQGDLSLEGQHFGDAARAYHLALAIDPNDARARAGYVQAETSLAATMSERSLFVDALNALRLAARQDPQNVRIAGLIADISNARLRSEIVRSNFPAYRPMTADIEHAYEHLQAEHAEVIAHLKRFGYTYDTTDLTRAIRASLDLSTETARLTARLSTLRTLVSAGSITATGRGSNAPESLLPIP